jgi:hypothetical protein
MNKVRSFQDAEAAGLWSEVRFAEKVTKNRNAVALGRRGGKVKSKAKTRAVRENGKLGGRPRKQGTRSRD